MDQHDYTIHGVPLKFPCKAYPSQIAMMDKILTGLSRGQNSLIESPTGSGKSLALLCACLAWQKKEKEKINEMLEMMKNDLCVHMDNLSSPSKKKNPATSSEGFLPTAISNSRSPLKQRPKNSFISPSKSDGPSGNTGRPLNSKIRPLNLDEGEDDDFKPLKRFNAHRASLDTPMEISQSTPQSSAKPDFNGQYQRPSIGKESPSLKNHNQAEVKMSPNSPSIAPPKMPKLIVSKIYFGTRTHKQITQIVHELKKTAYRDVKMVILSSRERACIHPEVSRAPNKNDACQALLDDPHGSRCSFHHNAKTMSYDALWHYGLKDAWDLDSFIKVGKKMRTCPYFGSRELVQDADIVFCPYNYLIDPQIRTSLDISLKDHILIFDEAHNIEDSARDAASLTVSMKELLDAKNDLDQAANCSHRKSPAYFALARIISGLCMWISKNIENLTDFAEFEKSSKVFKGLEIVAIFKDIGVGPEEYTNFKKHLYDAIDKDPDNIGEIELNGLTVHLLKGLYLTLSFMYRNEMEYIDDYRGSIIKTTSTNVPVVLPDEWLSKNKVNKTWNYSLNLWCLNPAVAFSDFKKKTHSIIVTSGTLSPLVSFESELGTPFPVQLEANHVISMSQVWVGTIGQGPSGSPVNATFKNTETYAFQDEVGKLIFQVCQTVPAGVLCFFPSYSMLEKLSRRWQNTGIWNEIEELKLIVSEPRFGGPKVFENAMTEFYEAIPTTDDSGISQDGLSGALFLAVCRGKVSEGLNFADNNARAVITIGIPFPNFKDIQINLKREYNDQHCRKRKTLSGSQWYEIQAFRALNQALGRCIRHKSDWGALILVDERLQKTPRYALGLSKWVRQRLINYSTFAEAESSLSQFMASKGANTNSQANSSFSSNASFSMNDTSLASTSMMPDRDSPVLFD